MSISLSLSFYHFSLISVFHILFFFLFFYSLSFFFLFSFAFLLCMYVSSFIFMCSSLVIELYLSISRSTSEQPQHCYNLHKTLWQCEVSANFEIYSHRVYRHCAKGSAIINVIVQQPLFDPTTL